MQIEYNRSGGVNYMILEGQQALLPYEEKMLMENMIPALLKFHIVKVNRRLCYWYDITGLKSVKSFVEREGLTAENVCHMVEAVAAAYRMLSEYLITEEKICISPESVFLKNAGNRMEALLCFLPQTEKQTGNPLLSLTEFWISEVDHEKEDVTKLCYALYEEAVKEGTGMTELLGILGENRKEAEESPIEENPVYAAEPKEAKESTEVNRGRIRKIFCKKEEEFQWDDPKDMTLDEVFADEEEEEEIPLTERILGFLKGIPGMLFGRFRKKKEEIFPPKDLEEDLIYDPHADYSEPTVLLTADKDSCFGKLIYEGTEKESDYMIETDDFHIGSSTKGNEAVLKSPVVSHHHARIIRENNEYYLLDLNSTNGTYLNGEAITLGQKYKLKYMDKLHFANVPYRIV